MVQRTVLLVACDVCGQEHAKRYVLAEVDAGAARGRAVDLCEEHAAPLADLMSEGRVVALTIGTEHATHAPAPRREAPNPTPIYTEEELDRLEQEGHEESAPTQE